MSSVCPPPVVTAGCGAASSGAQHLLDTEAPLWMYFAGVAVVLAIVWAWGWLSDHYEFAGWRLVRRLEPPCGHCDAHCPDGSES